MTTADLKDLFQTKCKEYPKHCFHPADLDRLKDEKYLTRVMKHSENDLKAATEMLWDVFTWRKNVGANDINESTIKMNYVMEGGFFPHGRDIDGSLMLIVKSKKHVKGAKDLEEFKKIIIYWFDRIEREENGKQITLFFDLDGCGLSNMDMELTNYLISLFKSYYPYFLNYIIIYQMPWVMSAAFKIIKSLLPAKGVEKMKFVNKDSLRNFVQPEQALRCWGGLDEYVFEFIPENKDYNEQKLKKVTFVDQNDSLHSLGEMLKLTPNNVIVFKSENDELTGRFNITNMDESAVSFKIRTTSPEKFRVRPSSGVLVNNAIQNVTIVVQPGFQLRNVSKDMFLVMSVQIPKTDLTLKELSDVWQKSSGNKVDEYRLKCQFPVKEMPKNGNYTDSKILERPELVMNTLNNLQMNYELMHRQVDKLKMYQFITLMLTVVSVLLGFLVFQNSGSNDRFCEGI